MRVIYLYAAVFVMAGLVGCQPDSPAPEKSDVKSSVAVENRVEAPAKPVAKMVEPVEKIAEKAVEVVKESVEAVAPVAVTEKVAANAPADTPATESAKSVEVVAEAPAKPEEVKVVVEPVVPLPVPAKSASLSQTAAVAGDAVKGAKLAKGKCGACHHFDKDGKKVGPSLMGIFGRAPSIDGVPFTTWDAAALDQWLENPKAVKSNTKMAFKGIPEKAKRDDIIAFLKSL